MGGRNNITRFLRKWKKMEGNLYYELAGWTTSASAVDQRNFYFNLARDLSLSNRKELTQCTTKGVPLVYHCRVTVVRPYGDEDDVIMSAKGHTAQQNWVTRNAAVKTHFAREAMYKNAGVKKSERGRYDKTLKLNYNQASQTWALPEFSDQNAVYTLTGSDWDPSKIAIDDDADLVPTLFGTIVDEESLVTADTFNIQNAYLASRRKPQVDDMSGDEDVASSSILRQMFTVDDERDDEIQALTQVVGDSTPYDSDAVAGTFTSESVAAYGAVGTYAAPQITFDVDVPFGLMFWEMRKRTTDGENTAPAGMRDPVPFHVEVLGVSEMQG